MIKQYFRYGLEWFRVEKRAKNVFSLKNSLKVSDFQTLSSIFNIIVIDLRWSFFDVVGKGDVHENVCS